MVEKHTEIETEIQVYRQTDIQPGRSKKRKKLATEKNIIKKKDKAKQTVEGGHCKSTPSSATV